jgi:soluble cytochrome b562
MSLTKREKILYYIDQANKIVDEGKLTQEIFDLFIYSFNDYLKDGNLKSVKKPLERLLNKIKMKYPEYDI